MKRRYGNLHIKYENDVPSLHEASPDYCCTDRLKMVNGHLLQERNRKGRPGG
uniref:Uncharacterized protein n=1 Tax=Siphoviridae sp. ct2u94 TaxID=2826277 RepID=A0A8S5QUY8_9CAUD|nr:MAG TPA: hypothetical protein [Siphoviridae sp. ct2u94]